MIYVYSAIASVTSVSVIIMSIVSFRKSNEKSLFGLNRDVHTTDYTRKGLLRKIEKRSGTGETSFPGMESVALCASSELGTGDGGGHGHVERFGGGTVQRVGGDEEFVGNEGFYLAADALAFVAHNDDAVGSEGTVVDVASVKESTVDGSGVGGCLREEIVQVGVMHTNARYGTHGGLYGLGIEDVCRFGGADDVLDAKPVGQSAYGAQISRVLNTVQSQKQLLRTAFRSGHLPLG